MSSYVLPALIAAACAAGIGYAVARTLHSRAERRTNELSGAASTAAPFDSRVDSQVDLRVDFQVDAAREPVFEDASAPEPVSEVPAPRIPRQDPAMAALTPPPASAGTPPLRSTTPHPSQALPPMLPPHLTGAHLLGVAARGTAITAVRSGTAGGLDVFDFADGGSIVVMPSDRDVAELVTAALGEGQDVRLLGTSEVGGGRSLTFQVHESTAFFLADRVYARPAA